MVAYLIVFLVAAGTTFALTPLVRRLAIRFGAIDTPSERKLHTVPTPTMGGLAMWAGFLVASGVSRLLPFFEPMNATAVEPLAAVVTCTMMVGLGVIDDRRGTIYVGSDVGVYYLKNGKKNWKPVGASGLPLAPVLDIRLHQPSSSLFASTFGRSMFRIDLPPVVDE